jgi:DNA polymerase-3 subunit delta
VSETPPVVYLLHGEDEFAITELIHSLQARMGDPATAEMNTTRLDGRSLSLDELVQSVASMPFFVATRRLVILTNPLTRLTTPTLRQKFLAILEKVPPTTALVLVEYRPLTDERDRRKGKLHWLEEWAMQAGKRVLMRAFPPPSGEMMVRWIFERAKTLGGGFSREAAERLAAQIGDEPRLADQEIRKLLEYVNYARAVEPEDVEAMTPFSRQGDIFVMVDALANRKRREALGMLHRLLEEQDYLSILGMVIRQFRLLILAREVLDQGGREAEVVREAGMTSFVAGKIVPQARQFTLPVLESIYHRLLEVDEAAKTGKMEGDLGLDLFMSALTQR